ncbi:MAG: hypothetical protein Q7S61_01555, partial [bacterium]|nr:hypothetical protein [bacterium]
MNVRNIFSYLLPLGIRIIVGFILLLALSFIFKSTIYAGCSGKYMCADAGQVCDCSDGSGVCSGGGSACGLNGVCSCGPSCENPVNIANPSCSAADGCTSKCSDCEIYNYCSSTPDPTSPPASTNTPVPTSAGSTCTPGCADNYGGQGACGYRNSDCSATTNNSCCHRVCGGCNSCTTVSGGGTNDCNGDSECGAQCVATNTPIPPTSTNTPIPPTATPIPPTATPTLPPCPYSCADASACALSGGTGLSGYNCGGGVCCQFGPTATYTPVPTASPTSAPVCTTICYGNETICSQAGSCSTCDVINGCMIAPTATNTPPPGSTNTPTATRTPTPGPATSTPTAVPTSGPVCGTFCAGNESICLQAGSCTSCNSVTGCEIVAVPTGSSMACDNPACGMPEATCTANGGLSWSPSDISCGGNSKCCLPVPTSAPSTEPPPTSPPQTACTGTCRSFCLANESGGYGTSCPSLCCYPIPTTGPCTMTASVVAGKAPFDSSIKFSSGTSCYCNGFNYGDGANDTNACNGKLSYSAVHTYNFESDPGNPYHANASCLEIGGGFPTTRTCSVDVTATCPTQSDLSNIAASNVICVGGYSNTIDISGGQKVVPKSSTP